MAVLTFEQLSKLVNSLKCSHAPVQELQKLQQYINGYPNVSFPVLVKCIFGSLDGKSAGLDLHTSRANELGIALDFVGPCGPMMQLVYKLQAEGYKYEIPVYYLPGPVKASIQKGLSDFPDCPLFRNKLQTPLPDNLTLNPFEFFMFNFAHSLIASRHRFPVQHGRSRDSAYFVKNRDNAYFVLVNTYLKYFLPIEGSVPPFSDPRGSITVPPIRSPIVFPSLHKPSLFKPHIFHQPIHVDPAIQGIWRSETLLQTFVEMWLHHYSLEMYQNLQSPQVQLAVLQYRLSMCSTRLQKHVSPDIAKLHTYLETFSPTEEHMRVVLLLVKHLHAFSNSVKQGDQNSPSPSLTHFHTPTSPLDELKKVVIQRFVQPKLYLFLQHCLGDWPIDECFTVLLDTWLSYIQPWKDAREMTHPQADLNRAVPDKWALFIQENLLMYTKLFQVFLNRVVRTDLANSKNAARMIYWVSEVFLQPNLVEMIKNGEQLFLERDNSLHHLKGSYWSPCQTEVTETVLRVKSHIYALEGQDCQYKQMFGTDVRATVLKLIQIIARAKQTRAKRFLGPSDDLTKTLNNLCVIFSVSSDQLNQLLANQSSSQEEVNSKELPDCKHGEAGRILTDLGRTQIISGLRRFDPDHQPVRGYEWLSRKSKMASRTLLRTMLWLGIIVKLLLDPTWNTILLLIGWIGFMYFIKRNFMY